MAAIIWRHMVIKNDNDPGLLDRGRKKVACPHPGRAYLFADESTINMAALGAGASNERSPSADVETQKREITELMKKKLVKGDTW